MTHGIVKWFSARKGYGFIETDEVEGDVFVHFSEIQSEPGEFRTLNDGDEVEFEINDTPKGPEARQLKVSIPAPLDESKLYSTASSYYSGLEQD